MMTESSSLLAPGRMVPVDIPQQQSAPLHRITESTMVPGVADPGVTGKAESSPVDKQAQELPAAREPPNAAAPAPAAPAGAQHTDVCTPAASTAAASPPACPAGQPSTGLTKLERETALFMLNLLAKYKEADPFRQPVDWQGLQIPDYPEIIKQPMDLRTAREKVRSGAYNSMDEWRVDMALIWNNCRKYNGNDHPVTRMAEKLEAAMERRMEEAVAGAAREVAAQQQRASEGKGLTRPKVHRELALLRASNTSAGSDSDGGEPSKLGMARAPSGPPRSGVKLEQQQARSSDAAAGATKSPTDSTLRLSLKRVASGSNVAAAAGGAAAAAAGDSKGPSGGPPPKRSRAANNTNTLSGAAGGLQAAFDYESLEQLAHTQAAKHLGAADADDVAFLAVWKRVVAKRSQAAAEADGLRQTNKKLRRSLQVSEEEASALRARLDAETAAREAAGQELEKLQKEHKQLKQQYKVQHQVLEHQRQLLEQQQQVLRQILKQQQAKQQEQEQPAPGPQQQQQNQQPAQSVQQAQQQPVQQAAPVLHREQSPGRLTPNCIESPVLGDADDNLVTHM